MQVTILCPFRKIMRDFEFVCFSNYAFMQEAAWHLALTLINHLNTGITLGKFINFFVGSLFSFCDKKTFQ